MRLLAFLTLLAAAGTVAAEADLGRFVDVRWEQHRDGALGLALRYPYEWTQREGILGDEVFFAAGGTALPFLSIRVLDRPAELTLDDAVAMAAAAFPGPGHVVDSRAREIGGVPVRDILIEWSMPLGLGLALRSRVISLFRDDRWVLVTATDGQVASGFMPALNEALDSLTIETVEGDAR